MDETSATVWSGFVPVPLLRPLRVTMLGMHYAPEPSGNAPYTTALARGLAARGHQVTVITGTPHYPRWSIYPGYGQWSRTTTEDQVRVTRLRHYVAERPTGARRAIMEMTYGARAAARDWSDADVAICVSPALLGSGIVSLAGHLRRGPPMGLWIQDLYSRGVAETTGRLIAARAALSLERRLVRAFDGVAVAHERFSNTLIQDFGINANRVRVIRNWMHLQPDIGDVVDIRQRLGWSVDHVTCVHAGNMGVKQSLENVVEAARVAERAEPHLRFVFIGGGNQESRIKTLSADLSNVQFIDSLDDRDFRAALRAADVLLVNERPGVKEMSVPSKLTSYFASGRPVVAAVDPTSVTAGEIALAGAGVCVDPTAPAELVDAVARLGMDPAQSDRLGQRGLAFAREVLSEETALNGFECWLHHMAN